MDDWVISAGVLAASALGIGTAVWVFLLLLERVLRRKLAKPEVCWQRVNRPEVLTSASLAVYLAAPAAGKGIDPAHLRLLTHAFSLVAITGVGWLILMATDVVGEAVSSDLDISKEDNRKERAILTKFRVMRRLWIGLVTVCTAGTMLMTFPSIRSLGAGMLASAGVAGLVLGIALRPTLETMLASVQVALTEPINLDDVVIVEGEWGRIEEVRKEVGKFVEADPNFDRRFWNVQITEADDRAMRLRVLCTAANASRAWELRCSMREKLISWLQQHHPGSLLRLRADIEQEESSLSTSSAGGY